MKICITGATGFLGSQIVRQLYPLGHELIMVVRNKELVPDELKANHTVIRADLTKPIDPITCDVLIHCAALVSEKTLSFYLNKANIDGTRNILNAIPKEAKVIHISCSSVYNLTQRLHNEEDEINPTLLTPYGRSKLKSEQVLKEEFSNRGAYILRIQNLYGLRNTDLLKRLVKLYKGGELKVPGDLDQKVTMTHVDYLIELIKRLIDVEFSGIECLNII
jgi:nucleoside-diphosphate-sugar epimerase